MRKLITCLTLTALLSAFFLSLGGSAGCTPAQTDEFNDPNTTPERKVELAAQGVQQATTNPLVQGAAAVVAPGWGNVALGATGAIAGAVGMVAGFLGGRKSVKKRKRKKKAPSNAPAQA